MLGPMEPASPSKPEKQRKGGLVFALGLLAGIAIASVAIWWSGNRPLSPDSLTVLNIGDGRGQMGREILAAAAVLSNERVVRIEFTDKEFGTGSVETIPQNVVAKMPCDWMSMELATGQLVMNGEVLSQKELANRLATYAESARLTETRPSLILHCDHTTSGGELVGILSLLAATKVDRVILPDHRWIFAPRPTPPPAPQIKPLAHPVELK